MRPDRRTFLATTGAVSLASVSAALWPTMGAQAADYKAVVVVFLTGGHDGNNMLVPLDAAYADYQRSRPALALPRDSLLPLTGSHMGHRFGFAPSMRALVPLFERRRLAVVANVGALVQPTTLGQIRDRTARLPLALGSHLDQERWIQGWMGDEGQTGWGGRSMEQLPAALRARQPLVTLAAQHLAVVSDRIPVSQVNSNSVNGRENIWGFANLDNPTDSYSQRVMAFMRRRSGHAYEDEFARSLRTAWEDSGLFSDAMRQGPAPTGDFPADTAYSRIGSDLRFVARYLPFSRSQGAQRQVVLVQDDGYDTHAGQMSTNKTNPGLDLRLERVAQSLVAFDQSLINAGLDQQVLLLVMSEFGRTLDDSGGQGSDHAWGNHWFALGGMVRGGIVHGETFPTLVTGGASDASIWNPRRGQWLPQFSSDQFVADAMRWMGLSEGQTVQAMPHLANFSRRTVGYL